MANFFVSTVLKSALSIPAQVMQEKGLNRVVFFVLRGGAQLDRYYLYELLGDALIARVPLRIARREMLVCVPATNCSDTAIIQSYNTLLQHVFGPSCRVRVRVLNHIQH